MNRQFFKIIAVSAASLYIFICSLVYLFQARLIFPSYAAEPVPSNWQPSISKNDVQTLLKGQCGQLHVVYWGTLNDKGTLMLFHGNAESISSVQDYVPWIQKFGYSVMTWDYAGYGKSSPCLFGNQDKLLKDAETAYQWLTQRVKPSKVTIFGRSIGTGLAIHVASQHDVHQLILVSPYNSLAKVAADYMSPIIPTQLITRYPMPAYKWIIKVRAPIYAVHGAIDTLIKLEYAQALIADAPTNAGIKPSLTIIPGAGHNVASFPAYEQWLTKILRN